MVEVKLDSLSFINIFKDFHFSLGYAETYGNHPSLFGCALTMFKGKIL